MSRLPAMRPVVGRSWITVDDAYAGQLAYKAQLVAHQRERVIGQVAGAEAACLELLSVVLAELPNVGFTVESGQVVRPDGEMVRLDDSDPLGTLSHLLQEDLCLLQKRGEEHVLTAAVLCFPAAWTLAQKLGHPLTRIHVPVKPYTEDIARRVQRLFDGVQPGKPIWRANLHTYDDPELFHVRKEGDPRPYREETAEFERSERQTVLRLPQTDAVLFAIHTTMTRRPVSS